MGSCFSQDQECVPSRKTIQHAKGLPIDKVYKLKTKIGGGAFGSVWLSHRKDYPKFKFAIKKINKTEVGTNELELLRREIDVLREVDHPNIIKFYDTYEDSSHIFIVMEYCSGGELFTKITNNGCLNESEARVYMEKMLMAVSHLHSLKIVHRDLKTENFLFDSNSATKELKLVDFGLSNKFGKNLENLHSQVGTIYYVAPEVLKGSYDSKCDMWSLGVLMFTMLSGDLPFYDESLPLVYKKLNSASFTFAKSVWDGVSSTAKDLIRRLLVVDTGERFSATEALSHEWFESLRTKSSKMTYSIIESFNAYRSQSMFQREALRIMVKHLPQETIENVKQLFYSLDVTGSGFVQVKDLELALRKSGNFSEDLVNGITSCLDYQKTGAIYYSDFISAALFARRRDTQDEAMLLTFKQLDVENQGELTEESIRQAIEALGGSATDEKIESIVEAVNCHGGKISYDEFKELILGHAKEN
jgi:calcium-dependent protein kinase